MQRLTIIFLLIFFPILTQEALAWTVEEMFQTKRVSSPHVSPGGKEIAYTLSNFNQESQIWESWIYLSDVKGANIRKLHFGTYPQWSPDGKWVAFTLTKDGCSFIYLISPDSEKVQTVIKSPSSVIDYKWASNSSCIAFISKEKTTTQVYVYFLSKNELKNVTSSIQHNIGSIQTFNWSPDCKQITLAYHSTVPERPIYHTDLMIVDIENGQLVKSIEDQSFKTHPIFSPDGKKIAFVSATTFLSSCIKVLSLEDGTSQSLSSTPNNELFFTGSIIGWSPSGDFLYVFEKNKTLSEVYALSLSGKEIKRIDLGDQYKHSFSLNFSGTHLGFIAESCNHHPEIFVRDLASNITHPITNITNGNFFPTLPKTDVVHWKSNDGLLIEGLLTYPLNYESGRTYPLLLIIHGGPPGVFSQSFIGYEDPQCPYPVATFATHGYAVLRCNIRGSTGYGEKFRMSNLLDLGGGDFKDLMSGVDHAISMGIADSQRLGVMGWSYGGYLTAWIITQTNRFCVASVGAGIVDLISYAGTTDCVEFMPTYWGGEYWDNLSLYHERSPICHVQKVRTPTLIQHGEKDVRVPIGQAYQLSHALTSLHVPSKFTIYPHSQHVIGEPKLLIEALKENLNWFDLHLGMR